MNIWADWRTEPSVKANQSTFFLGEPKLGLLHRVHIRADSRRHCFEGGPHFWQLGDVLCPIVMGIATLYWLGMATTVDTNLCSMPNTVEFRLLWMTRTSSAVVEDT